MLPEEYKESQRQQQFDYSGDMLATFSHFEGDPRAEEERKSGRAWRTDELRLKCHDDHFPHGKEESSQILG